MKRLIILTVLGFSFIALFGSTWIYSQATFKISFKFEAEGKKLPPGDYLVEQNEDGKITLRRVTDGQEATIPIIKKLSQPDPPNETPQLIFDMVANFEPSYTEYITDYLLAEVWLTEKDGYLVLADERAEYTQGVKGENTKK
jgi:hypothetical protein